MAIPINMEYFDEYLRQGDPLKKERAEANIISTLVLGDMNIKGYGVIYNDIKGDN